MKWESPDGGEWFFEPAHFPDTVSRLFGDIIDRICDGWVKGAVAWGVNHGRARWAYINHYVYYGNSGEAIAGDEELAARTRRERWWVEEATRWFDEERPPIVAANRSFGAVDVSSLDDAALRDHVRRLTDHLLAVGPLHFSHYGRRVVRGELRERAKAEGVDEATLADAFAGASPASSRPAHMVAAIAHALAAAGVDVAALASLDDVRANPDAAAALGAYLDEFGDRLMDSYDLSRPTLREHPDIVLASIRAAANPQPGPTAVELQSVSDELRQLLEEARVSYGIEDDDDGVCIFWPSGLLRRALLELGRRLGLEDRAHIFEADITELGAVLEGRGPDKETLCDRAASRAAAELLDPPPVVGGTDQPASEKPADENAEGLRGEGIGIDIVRGRACVIGGGGAGLDDIQPGDVLIAVTTTPGHNVVMPIIAGVATETKMHHTVICARELGIPAVIGVAGACAAIPHGAMVELDPKAGTVRVIDE